MIQRNLFAIFISFFIFSLALCNPSKEYRIVGGSPARIQDFPYMASILMNGQAFCGGSIVHRLFIVTAAHCVYRYANRKMTVNVGSIYKNTGGESRNVSQIIIHKKYDNSTSDYDIAILKLDKNLTFTESINTVRLPPQGAYIPPNRMGVVTGWGYTQEDGFMTTVLQKVEVPIVSLRMCSLLYTDLAKITTRMICAGFYEGGRDACQGDSGGPLVVDGQLVGVVSWGFGCARPHYPGVYANVPNLRKWIDKVINASPNMTFAKGLLLLYFVILIF